MANITNIPFITHRSSQRVRELLEAAAAALYAGEDI
jgi:hypothetical protein